MVSPAQRMLSYGHYKRTGGVPWCGTNTESFTCFPVSAPGPGALCAAAGGWRRRLQWPRVWKPSWMPRLLVHFGRSDLTLCANPISLYIKLFLLYSSVPTSWSSNPIALHQAVLPARTLLKATISHGVSLNMKSCSSSAFSCLFLHSDNYFQHSWGQWRESH